MYTPSQKLIHMQSSWRVHSVCTVTQNNLYWLWWRAIKRIITPSQPSYCWPKQMFLSYRQQPGKFASKLSVTIVLRQFWGLKKTRTLLRFPLWNEKEIHKVKANFNYIVFSSPKRIILPPSQHSLCFLSQPKGDGVFCKALHFTQSIHKKHRHKSSVLPLST